MKLGIKYTVLHSISSWSELTIFSSQYWTEVGLVMVFSNNVLYIALQDRWRTLNFKFDSEYRQCLDNISRLRFEDPLFLIIVLRFEGTASTICTQIDDLHLLEIKNGWCSRVCQILKHDQLTIFVKKIIYFVYANWRKFIKEYCIVIYLNAGIIP